MRDITEDLKERVEATRAELSLLRTKYDQDRRELEAKFSDQLGKASARLQALETVLQEESGLDGPRLPVPDAKALRLPLQDFILNSLQSYKVITKDEIKDLAERAGYVDENGSAGRMVHTTLFNAVKAGRIVNNGDRYELPSSPGFFQVIHSLKEKGPPADPASEP